MQLDLLKSYLSRAQMARGASNAKFTEAHPDLQRRLREVVVLKDELVDKYYYMTYEEQ